VPRRAPFAVPRWNGAARAPKSAVDPVPGGTRRAVLRGAPSAPCRWPGVLPRRAGDGCARKRSRCGDAPIRRSGPPRHRAHGAGGGRSSRLCHVKSPPRCRCRSADAWRTIKPPPGAGSAPDDRDEALPVTRGSPTGFRSRSRGVSVALRLHPPRWADVRARRNLTEQPTSRLCSADESVVTSCRCQRPVTRSFHGLCSPPRSRSLRSSLAMPDQKAPGPSRSPGSECPGRPPWRQAAALSGHWAAFGGSPSPPAAEAVGETDDMGSRSRVPLRRLFNAGAGAPCRSLDHARNRSCVCRPRQCLR
jgi:hypothetical protein